jgi:thioredoxin 1
MADKSTVTVTDQSFAEYSEITVAKMDIDANPSTPRNYRIMSIPTMIVFSGGKPVKQIVGAKPKAALLQDLAEYLS